MAVAYRSQATATAATTTTVAVNLPAGVVAGDIMVAFISATLGVGGGTITAPAGWTGLAQDNTGSTSTRLFTKTATASEAASFTFTTTQTGAYLTGAIVAYSGASQLDTNAGGNNAGTTAPATPNIVTTYPQEVVLYFAHTSGTTITQTGGTNRVASFGAGSGTGAVGWSIMGEVAQATAGTPTAPTFTTGTSGGWGLHTLALAVVTAPAAPTNTAPANATYLDTASGATFSAVYNSTDGANQNAYALRVKTSGAGTYNYWNVSTNALQSTIVWNSIVTTPGSSFSVTLTSAAVPNGSTYNVSFASQEAFNNLQGPFAADSTFTAQAGPQVTVTAPTGIYASNQATVTWSDTLPSGAVQTNYRLVIEHGAYGSTPGAGTSDFDSGVLTSNATTSTPSTNLANNATYRAFVQVTETGGQVSAWAFTTFTISLDPPAVPVVSAATFDPTNNRIAVVVQGRDNVLTFNQSTLETDTTGWTAGANTTIARSTAQFSDGVASLSLTSTAAGAMSATTPTGTSGVAVVAGVTYTVVASFRTAVTAQSCTVAVGWYTAAGALISTSTSTTVADTTAGFTQASITTTAPATSAFAAVVVNVLSTAAAAEVHYVDVISLAPGTSATWARGGLAGIGTALLQRSVDGGVTYTTVRGAGAIPIPTPSQTTGTVYDYEVIPGAVATYRASVTDII